ncbi:MAG: DNA translocase FtsK [Bacteroidales bacterium]|nr:DNA translocase FtsK [Bacteroidales bacterium]
MKANKTRTESNKSASKGKTKRSKSGLKGFFKSVWSLLSNPKFHRILGLFLTIASLAMAVAFISFFFTWQADQAIPSGSHPENWIGSAGRAVSKLFIERWFGLAAFALIPLLLVWGVKLLSGFSLLPPGKTARMSLLALVWFCATFGFLFGNHDTLAVLGGGVGRQLSIWLVQLLGKIGTGLLLLFVLTSFLILQYNFSFRFLRFFLRRNPHSRDQEDGDPVSTDKDILEPESSLHDAESDTGDETNEMDIADSGIVEPVIGEVNDPDPGDADTPELYRDVELIVENPAGSEKDIRSPDGEDEPTEKHVSDDPYDPTLDLPSYVFPVLELLEDYGSDSGSVQKEELERNKKRIVETLGNYSIEIQKIKATIGPTVTLYEIVPAPGIRISRIKNLEDDIALSLSALGIRIIAPIPGKGTIGIEVPNQNPEIVSMKSVLASDKFRSSRADLPFGIGKTISSESYIQDLSRMPHILMAGATGQGKSVGLNAIITSLLYRKHPSELKFVMVDPKKVELTLYSKIERHFLAKLPDSEEAIITDTRKVVRTLNSLGIEMDNRYELFKDAQVRNIKEYNVKFKARKLNPLHGHRFLPYIVLVIDEFADLIMTAGKEIEGPITRLAQLARAVGIHLIIATQRPSVNIITGSIKANFPARVAFRVISKIDSRTILDTSGADQLIGRGDMLFSTGNDLIRLQCAFVDTPEVERITDFIGSQRGYPDAYHLPEFEDTESERPDDYDPNERDELFEDAARIIVQTQQGSTSLLQRKLKLGYNRAGRIIDQLEAAGIVGPFEGSKAREVKIANEMALEQYLRDINDTTHI